MENDITDSLTYTTVKINCSNNSNTSTGTGFIINLCENGDVSIPSIITNLHVIKNGVEYSFELCLADESGKPCDQSVIKCVGKTSEWILHPKGLDLVCLPFGKFINDMEKRGVRPYYRAFDINLIPTVEQLNELSSIEDIYLIGYPTGIEDTFNHKPMVRKGITATHPKRDFQGKKEFIIDCPVFPGSSGSPVVLLYRGTYSTSTGIVVGNKFMLLGIAYATFTANLISQVIETGLTTIPKVLNNLGIVIKSSELLDFETILKSKL